MRVATVCFPFRSLSSSRSARMLEPSVSLSIGSKASQVSAYPAVGLAGSYGLAPAPEFGSSPEPRTT